MPVIGLLLRPTRVIEANTVIAEQLHRKGFKRAEIISPGKRVAEIDFYSSD